MDLIAPDEEITEAVIKKGLAREKVQAKTIAILFGNSGEAQQWVTKLPALPLVLFLQQLSGSISLEKP